MGCKVYPGFFSNSSFVIQDFTNYVFIDDRPMCLELSPEEEVVVTMHMDIIRYH